MMKDQVARITVRNLRKSFGTKHVLSGVDFDVAPGESFMIVGPSGTGKSVLIKCMLGLVEPDAGEIRIDGEDIARTDGRDRKHSASRFGMLFQGNALFDSMTVWENVAFRSIHDRSETRSQARISAIETLGLVGLGEEIANLNPSALSGGMMKRVALARTIATKPDIVFLDEPTAGLDPITSGMINVLIKSVSQTLGITTVTISHDMASVFAIADRVAMLHEGKLIWTGPVDRVWNSGNAYVNQFINGNADGPVKMKIHRP